MKKQSKFEKQLEMGFEFLTFVTTFLSHILGIIAFIIVCLLGAIILYDKGYDGSSFLTILNGFFKLFKLVAAGWVIWFIASIIYYIKDLKKRKKTKRRFVEDDVIARKNAKFKKK